MSDENQQSIFSDFESRIREREWSKAVRKVRTARYSLFFLALVSALFFCISYIRLGAEYGTLAITLFYLFLFYFSRHKPFISFLAGIICSITRVGIWSYNMYYLYNKMDSMRLLLSLNWFIGIMVTIIFVIFLVKGMYAGRKLDHLQALEDSIQKER
jgi:hypothetical protein